MDGMPFTPLRIDLAEYSAFAKPISNQVPVVAVFPDLHEETITFTIDGVIDGNGPLADFQTFAFPPHWQNLLRLRFTESRFAFDNVVLVGSTVPDLAPPVVPAPLRNVRVLAALPNPTPSGGSEWVVHRRSEGNLLLASVSSSDTINSYAMLYPSGQLINHAVTTNPLTRESTQIVSGAGGSKSLRQQLATGSSIMQATTGGTWGIDSFDLPRPCNGRAAFADFFYAGAEKYAIFIAQSGTITPVVLPTTVLPGGGMPHHFPDQLFFENDALAFPSSTSLETQADRWFLLFPQRSLIAGLAEGQLIPGTNQTITSLGKLTALTMDRARYLVKTSDGAYLLQTDRDAVHTVLAASTSLKTAVVPGFGVRMTRFEVTAFDAGLGLAYTTGMTRSDEGGEYLNAACVESAGIPFMVMTTGQLIAGIGAVSSGSISLAEDGLFYAVVRNPAGQRYLIEAAPILSSPAVTIAEILQLPDARIRLVAHYLTLDKNYIIERATDPGGVWEQSGAFTGRAFMRSVPALQVPGGTGYYRLRYPP